MFTIGAIINIDHWPVAKNVQTCHQSLRTDGRTHGVTDGRTDGQTTDGAPSYRLTGSPKSAKKCPL